MAVTTLFYGCYVLTFLFATVVLCCTTLVDLIKVGFVDLPGSDLIRQFQMAQAHMRWMFVLDNWPMNVNMSVNDAILVWRVCCLFSRNIWVRIPVCLLGAVSSGLALALAIGGSVELLKGEEGETLSGTEKLPDLPTVWMAVSIFTNVVCIGLISRIAWQHRATLLLSKRTSSVQKILSLLVESGVVFVLLQITLVVTQSIPRPLLSTQDIAFASIIRAVTISAAIVPPLVLVIVSQGDSLSHSDGSPGPFDGESMEWEVVKPPFDLEGASNWNTEPVVIRIDTVTTVERPTTGDEV
ncbi:hypothetical protein DL96DRAFT_1586432 [Flagelloscypha sp. PMI_526]|nr:hypothetical protein DL96DRAFT_1586432 [Flagelloscypha sp. PMI_526]